MAEVCTCDTPLGNTGRPACQKKYLVVKDLILTPLIGSAGTANTYDVSAGEPTLSTIQADLNAADPLDRIYPIRGIENVENVRDESIFQEFNSGKKVKVREGFKTFTGFVPNVDPVYVGKVKSAGCSAIGAFRLDTAGNFQFSARKSDGIVTTAYPIEIDSDTFDVRYVESTDGETFGMMMDFQWKETEKDSYLRQVSVNWNASDLQGLLDVNSSVVVDSATQFTATLVDDYGNPVEGLVLGDFTVTNLTTASGLTPSAVTETSDGVYQFTIPAQTPADVLELDASKTGFDFTKVKANTFVAL